MYNSLTKILFAASTASLFLACADDFEPLGPARFADLSAEQQHAVITATLGFPEVYGVLTARAVAASSEDSASCPARLEQDGVVTYNADIGCTAASGQHYAGRLQVHGSLDGGAYALDFDAFRAASLYFSGTISRSAPDAEGRTVLGEFLTFALGEQQVVLHSQLRCDADGRCSTDGDDYNARGALPGVGQFDLEIERTPAPSLSGFVELRGVDTLRVELVAARDGSGCYPYTIDGREAGAWCGAGR